MDIQHSMQKKIWIFLIQINNLTGDRDFNNSLKSELNRYFNIEKAKIKILKLMPHQNMIKIQF